MMKDSLLNHTLSLTESSYFKYSSQRWKSASVKRYYRYISQVESHVAGEILNRVVNSLGDLWDRQWFRSIPTEFCGRLGKVSDSSEEWRCFQRLSPRVKPLTGLGISGFYAQGSIRREMVHTACILLFLIMEYFYKVVWIIFWNCFGNRYYSMCFTLIGMK